MVGDYLLVEAAREYAAYGASSAAVRQAVTDLDEATGAGLRDIALQEAAVGRGPLAGPTTVLGHNPASLEQSLADAYFGGAMEREHRGRRLDDGGNRDELLIEHADDVAAAIQASDRVMEATSFTDTQTPWHDRWTGLEVLHDLHTIARLAGKWEHLDPALDYSVRHAFFVAASDTRVALPVPPLERVRMAVEATNGPFSRGTSELDLQVDTLRIHAEQARTRLDAALGLAAPQGNTVDLAPVTVVPESVAGIRAATVRGLEVRPTSVFADPAMIARVKAASAAEPYGRDDTESPSQNRSRQL